MAWVSVAELKNDQSLDGQVTSRDDEALQRALDAAVAWVEPRRPDVNFLSGPSPVPDSVRLGTLRLAARWFVRRNSPDGLVALGELGTGRVPRVDNDIIMQLGLTVTFA